VAVALRPAGRDDARALAALHVESWRSAYRDLVPDTFLAEPVVADRLRLWESRMAVEDAARLVLKAEQGGDMVGFTCVLRDAEPAWGPLLDNLHVRPALKGLGIGRVLFRASRDWSSAAAPDRPMHLWVIEGNAEARRFYDRQGGEAVERQVIELTAGIFVPALRYVWR
jgi:GNAT superfamily N-acetyltransferase